MFNFGGIVLSCLNVWTKFQFIPAWRCVRLNRTSKGETHTHALSTSLTILALWIPCSTPNRINTFYLVHIYLSFSLSIFTALGTHASRICLSPTLSFLLRAFLTGMFSSHCHSDSPPPFTPQLIAYGKQKRPSEDGIKHSTPPIPPRIPSACLH